MQQLVQHGGVVHSRRKATLVVECGSAVKSDLDCGAFVSRAPHEIGHASGVAHHSGPLASACNGELQLHALALERTQAVPDLLGNDTSKGVGRVGHSPVRNLQHGLAGQLCFNLLLFGVNVDDGLRFRWLFRLRHCFCSWRSRHLNINRLLLSSGLRLALLLEPALHTQRIAQALSQHRFIRQVGIGSGVFIRLLFNQADVLAALLSKAAQGVDFRNCRRCFGFRTGFALSLCGLRNVVLHGLWLLDVRLKPGNDAFCHPDVVVNVPRRIVTGTQLVLDELCCLIDISGFAIYPL